MGFIITNELKMLAKNIFESGLDEIANLLKNINGVSELNQQFKRDFQENILAVDFSSKEILEFLDQYSAAISVLVFEDHIENEIADAAGKSIKLPWKVLLLDDEPESLDSLKRNLEKRGIEYLLAQTVDEAEKIITDDIYNEITVAVSDYRLLEQIDGVEKHQRRQGYDFLFWLAEQDRLTHLIALSGLSRKFLLESFQKYNTRVDVHSKQDLTADRAVNLFIDNILDRGSEIYESICSHPSVGNWKDLKPFYAAHRASTNYQLKEQEINNRATQYLRQYSQLLETRDEKQLLRPDLEDLKDLSAKLNNKQVTDPKAMNIFYNKLIARRIGLWLQLNLNFPPKEVFAVLQGHLNSDSKIEKIQREKNGDNFIKNDETQKKDAMAKYKNSMTDLVTTHLCLSASVSSFEILVEEKYWLKHIIGIREFNSSFELARQIPYLVQVFVERFLDSSPNIEQELKDKHQDLFVLYGKEENKKVGKLQIIGFTDAKEVIESIIKLVSAEDEKQDLRKLLSILYKNIAANIGESPRRNEFLDYLNIVSYSLDK